MKLRSLLFVPGDRPDQIEKARAAGADALILDLEDAVAAAHKGAARRHVVAALARSDRPMPVFVRLNPRASGLLEEDLAALADALPGGFAPPDGFVLPKAEGAASICDLGDSLARSGLARPILPIATETPLAIFRLGEYASVADRLCGLTWGAEDLPAAIGASQARNADGSFTPPYEVARALSLFAAHAAGVAALETVYPAFRDDEGLQRYATRAARDGFTGMLAIHPRQVPVINAAFTPALDAVEHARRVVAAFAASPGRGVIDFEGAMVDAPHLRQARQLLARAGD
jgi:citrate lyase subunit beta/citryl-CoA lyase